MTILDRLITDRDYYVKVQKTKLVICIVGLSIIAIRKWDLIIDILF